MVQLSRCAINTYRGRLIASATPAMTKKSSHQNLLQWRLTLAPKGVFDDPATPLESALLVRVATSSAPLAFESIFPKPSFAYKSKLGFCYVCGRLELSEQQSRGRIRRLFAGKEKLSSRREGLREAHTMGLENNPRDLRRLPWVLHRRGRFSSPRGGEMGTCGRIERCQKGWP